MLQWNVNFLNFEREAFNFERETLNLEHEPAMVGEPLNFEFTGYPKPQGN
jgi:hypothetical protein